MKHFFSLCLVFSVITSGLAQSYVNGWNSVTATYENPHFGISWQLINELKWVERPAKADDVLLKVLNEDTHIMVLLKVSEINDSTVDAWDMLPMYNADEYQSMTRNMARNLGMSLQYSQPIRSQLCGRRAVKVTTNMTKYHKEQDMTVHSVTYMYQVVDANHIYTLSIVALSLLADELKDFERISTMLINGFNINQKPA